MARAVLPPVAREVATTKTVTELIKFVSFTDFVPCDYNQDGIVDILVLNHRLSTGYGVTGVGNGLFVEGPSFGLPFRPAAAVGLGRSPETRNGLFLVSADGVVSIFYPMVVEEPSTGVRTSRFSAFRVDTAEGVVFVVAEEGKASVHLYAFVDGGVQDRGENPASRSKSILAWCEQLQTWTVSSDGVAFPLPPSDTERLACIEDLNGDLIPDLVYYESGKIVWRLSKDGKPVAAEKTTPCHTKPSAIRTADVDRNGFADVLVLFGPSGTLEAYLTTPK